jgi:hypothetical protein
MTADQPDGAALLAEARRTLLELLLPLLPPARRYDGLMVANAMAIAAREFGEWDETLRESLAEILNAPLPPACSGRDQTAELEARLARQIRAGQYDAGDGREAVRRYLRAATLARVRLSNPKLLGE